MDKRKKKSEIANLYDYLHAKLLLDVLAEYGEFDNKLESALLHLCQSWGVKDAWLVGAYGKRFDALTTIGHLSQHCLSHGREEVKERQSDTK